MTPVKRVQQGDRFRTTREATLYATFIQYAPAHTVGARARVPAGTVLIVDHAVPGAAGFSAYPEAYDRLEPAIVPEVERSSRGYAGGYVLAFNLSDVGGLLQPLAPLNPRTAARLPRVARFPPWGDCK